MTKARFDMETIQRFGTLASCLILVAVVAGTNSAFLSFLNINNMLSQWSPAGIMAIGMTVVIVVGGFDLSIAANYSMCAVVAALLGQTHAAPLAFGVAVMTGGLVGLANAILIVRLRINPYIATVGSGFVVTGLSLVATQNAAIIVSNPSFAFLGAQRWNGIPMSGILFIAIALCAAFVLVYTVYGHMIYAVGGNAEASRLSGLPVARIQGGSYVLLGLCCGIAGFICASQLNSAQSTVDGSILFDVVTIVILGGTSFGGGVGSIWQTIVGLVMVATISNGFVMMDINPFYQSLFKGLIIVAALMLDSLLKSASGRGPSSLKRWLTTVLTVPSR